MLTSITRTLLPFLVGGAVSLLSLLGITANADLKATLTSLATFVIGGLYYIIVRLLEKKYPKLGVLLGVPTPPTYTK